MGNTDNTIRVRTTGSTALFSVTGSARAQHAPAFHDTVTSLCRRDVDEFILDLTDCILLDSTFFGGLVRLADPPPPIAPILFTVVNPSPQILRQLQILELLPFLRVVHGERTQESADDHSVKVIDASQAPDRAALTRFCLDAHRVLSALSDANRQRFQSVTDLLAAELAETPAKPPTPSAASGASEH